MTLRIGLDFDNTIICYDGVFLDLARAQGLVAKDFRGDKAALRDAVRRQPDGETQWQKLQGQVYGARIAGAKLFEGVDHFLTRCQQRIDTTVFIVSHKTELGHFDEAKVNLRDAARRWMVDAGFFDAKGFGLSPDNLYFEGSRDAKIDRIVRLGCTHFIDDLEEVLDHPRFPAPARRILFSPGGDHKPAAYPVCASWREIEERVFDHAGS